MQTSISFKFYNRKLTIFCIALWAMKKEANIAFYIFVAWLCDILAWFLWANLNQNSSTESMKNECSYNFTYFNLKNINSFLSFIKSSIQYKYFKFIIIIFKFDIWSIFDLSNFFIKKPLDLSWTNNTFFKLKISNFFLFLLL